MAYRCPVCDAPQTDAEHLANHLAFTAVIRGDAHGDWLDDHVPGWGEENPDTLAPKVAEAVPEVDVPELEDDDGGHDHVDHGGGASGGRLEDELAGQGGHRGPGAGNAAGAGGAAAGGRGDLTDDAAGVMEEARQLTEQMYGLDETDADGEDADREGGGSGDADADVSADGDADADVSADGDADGDEDAASESE